MRTPIIAGNWKMNMTPAEAEQEACALARDAGVKTLYLTHMWGKYDTEAEVKKEIDFPSAVVVQERGRYCI